jgi:CRP/FNR family transcriptional regulator, cyclic AMP receptor protein
VPVLLPNWWQPGEPSLAGTVSGNTAKLPIPVRNGSRGYSNPLPAWRFPLREPSASELPANTTATPSEESSPRTDSGFHPEKIDPFYLFVCHIEWKRRAEPSAAWELLGAAQSSHEDTRAHARALLADTHPTTRTNGLAEVTGHGEKARRFTSAEASMKGPDGLENMENLAECTCAKPGFFCAFSKEVSKSFDHYSHRSLMPTGVILFIEGQMSRGIFILCSGRVKLSTTSRDGKVLVLKTAEAGEALGLSAAIAGQTYEMTAETATSCQVNFIDRKSLMSLLQSHSEVGMHAAQCLSRDFQSAYRDIHDLVLARSSAGKLARLLLSCCPGQVSSAIESRLHSAMTHEEMAQRIGSSRETVTRLLSDLRRKQFIRLDGTTLVIRNRTALEALAF